MNKTIGLSAILFLKKEMESFEKCIITKSRFAA